MEKFYLEVPTIDRKMKIIYLLSGPLKQEGLSNEIKESLKKDLNGKTTISFISSSPDDSNKTKLYIYGDNDEVVGLINHLKDIIDIKGISIIDNRIPKAEGIKTILNSDVIYLLGGDPIKQLEFIKENEYDKAIKEYNGIILGTSAGAMNLGTISYYSKDEAYDKTFFYDGIGIVDVTVDPHFDITNEEQVEEAKKYSKEQEIIGLPNSSAIRIEDKDIEYINKCYVFQDGITYETQSNQDAHKKVITKRNKLRI